MFDLSESISVLLLSVTVGTVGYVGYCVYKTVQKFERFLGNVDTYIEKVEDDIKNTIIAEFVSVKNWVIEEKTMVKKEIVDTETCIARKANSCVSKLKSEICNVMSG